MQLLGGLASYIGTDKLLSIRYHTRSKTIAFQKISAVSKLVPLVNACLRPSKDETASDGDSLEEEMTASEESSSNGATLSTDGGASAHPLDQPEEDEDMDDEALGEGHETPSNFFRFGYTQFCDLFPPEDYSDLIAVLPSLHEDTRAGIENKKVLIVVEDMPPQSGVYTVRRKRFDLQVTCVLRAREKWDDPSKYEAVRYMRHERHEKFWKQERGDAVTSQCLGDLQKELESTYADNLYFYCCVSVYVQEGSTEAEDNWKTKFFESLGGQTHARCACKTYPLIPTNRSNADKLNCNVKLCTSADGNTTEIDECNRKEAYVCSNPLCNTRMCRRCFGKLPTDQMTIVAGIHSP